MKRFATIPKRLRALSASTLRVPLQARNTPSLPRHRFLSRSNHTPITSFASLRHPSHTPSSGSALPTNTKNPIQIP
jgi:hypothetical protein